MMNKKKNASYHRTNCISKQNSSHMALQQIQEDIGQVYSYLFYTIAVLQI